MKRKHLTAALVLCIGASAGDAQEIEFISAFESSTLATETSSVGYTYTPHIVVGDPNGSPSVMPSDRVDPNVSTSAFAGVVSLFFDAAGTSGGFLCSGTLISPNHILTAAHCVTDNSGNVNIVPGSSNVYFNHSGNLAASRNIAAIDIHPDWTGFNNPSINDDLAIITLASPAPTGAPIYSLNSDPFITTELITMVGYGVTGDGVDGFVSGSASFTAKRTGQNLASAFQVDDEGSGSREVFLFDFDGPDLTTSTLDAFGTLGNDIETTLGGGDSGGPSFLWNDDGDGIPQADEMILFGVNTFGRGGGSSATSTPLFGSQAGGMIVSTYEGWINEVTGIPEPSSGVIALLGMLLLNVRRRRA